MLGSLLLCPAACSMVFAGTFPLSWNLVSQVASQESHLHSHSSLCPLFNTQEESDTTFVSQALKMFRAPARCLNNNSLPLARCSILKVVKDTFNVPIITDIHESWQAEQVAQVRLPGLASWFPSSLVLLSGSIEHCMGMPASCLLAMRVRPAILSD